MSVAAAPRTSRPAWRDDLAPYTVPRVGRSLLDLATSVVPYVGLSVLMYLSLDVSYLLALALAIPTAGFLLRTYIVFHDCTHGSFLPSKRANPWVGAGSGCSSSRRSRAGATTTPSITRRPATSSAAAPATSRR